jgi:PPOX class probable F420-dependent enzyme
MSLWERLNALTDRVISRGVDSRARRISSGSADTGFDSLADRKYCVLISFRRDGRPVPTPVWFGLADGKLYARTPSSSAKVRRIAREPRVLVAASTGRGKPLGPAVEARARMLDSGEEQTAEGAIEANYGLGRRLYKRITRGSDVEMVYLEMTPAATAARAGT